MPFNDNLPAENTDPWYSPLVTAWNNLKTFVNGLETALSGKANTVHTHAAGDVTSGEFTQARIPNLNASKIATGTLAESVIPSLAISKTTGLQDALDAKADAAATTTALAGKASTTDLDNAFTIATNAQTTAEAALPEADVAGLNDPGWVRGTIIEFDDPDPVGLPDGTIVFRLPEA